MSLDLSRNQIRVRLPDERRRLAMRRSRYSSMGFSSACTEVWLAAGYVAFGDSIRFQPYNDLGTGEIKSVGWSGNSGKLATSRLVVGATCHEWPSVFRGLFDAVDDHHVNLSLG